MVNVTLRGHKYPALFDLQNVKEMQEHFGDLTALPEKLTDPMEAAYIIWLMVREGVELDNEEHHRDNAAPSLAMVQRLITYNDLASGVVDAVREGFMEFYGKNASGRQAMEAMKTLLKESGLMMPPTESLAASD